MFSDTAVKKRPVAPATISLLADLRHLCADVVPEGDFVDPAALATVFDTITAKFEGDYARVMRDAEILFGANHAAYGKDAADVFARWEDEGNGPVLPAILAAAVEHFALDTDTAPVRAAFVAAVLAEIPNDLLYHGNEHYRKVLFHTVRLIATHNTLFKGKPEAIGKGRIALLLTAACVHDLAHEGGDNLRDGVYTPGYMEQKALDVARPYFDAVDLGAAERGEIETIVFTTDITFFAGDNSPCVRMRKIYRHYFWAEDVGDASMLMMGRLRRYEDDAALVRLAMLLHEADVATSAGLTYEQTRKETMSIIEERGMKTAGPGIVLNFLREQLGQTMYTEAAKQLFGPGMTAIIDAAEADVAAGRQTYYD